MPKAVIPFELDLPEGSPLLSANAGEAQQALAIAEIAVAEALSIAFDADIPTVAIWAFPGTHRATTTNQS